MTKHTTVVSIKKGRKSPSTTPQRQPRIYRTPHRRIRRQAKGLRRLRVHVRRLAPLLLKGSTYND